MMIPVSDVIRNTPLVANAPNLIGSPAALKTSKPSGASARYLLTIRAAMSRHSANLLASFILLNAAFYGIEIDDVIGGGCADAQDPNALGRNEVGSGFGEAA